MIRVGRINRLDNISGNNLFNGDHHVNQFGTGTPQYHAHYGDFTHPRSPRGDARASPSHDPEAGAEDPPPTSQTNVASQGGSARRPSVPQIGASPHVHSAETKPIAVHEGDSLKPTWVDIAKEASGMTLKALNAACICPAPVKAILQLALMIVECAQQLQANGEAFKRLGNDTFRVVSHIIKTYEEHKPLEKKLDEDLAFLQSTLTEISCFVRKATTHGFLMRLTLSRWHDQKVREYRDILNQSMHLFGFRSLLTLRQDVQKLYHRSAYEPTIYISRR